MAASPFRVSSGIMLPSFGHFPNIMYLCMIFLCKVWEKARCGIAVATPYEANFFSSYRYAMYVIAEIQGQQFNVEQGRRLFIHHVKGAESGTVVEFDKVLLVDKDGAVTVGTPTVAGAKVVCEVITPLVKGDKVLVFHKKRRKGYRKLNGHRQQFSEVRVKEIIA